MSKDTPCPIQKLPRTMGASIDATVRQTASGKDIDVKIRTRPMGGTPDADPIRSSCVFKDALLDAGRLGKTGKLGGPCRRCCQQVDVEVTDAS